MPPASGGSKLGTAYVELTTDDSKLDKGLDDAERKVDASAKGMSSKFKGLMVGAAAAAGTIITVDAVKGFIAAGSDLNESLSKSNVVFGENGKQIEEWSKTTSSNFGISQRNALEAAGTFGNLFTTIGLGQAPAADMSEGIVQLAADLASFNNLDPTVVLDKLRSGLAGEAEPLRSMGVFLTEATVKAKGMELGLADANGELSEGAKVQARYALIMEQTGTAQGDFARTSDGLANKQRIVSAQWDDMQAQLGMKLQPAMIAAADVLLNTFFPAMGKAGGVVDSDVVPAIAKFVSQMEDYFGPAVRNGVAVVELLINFIRDHWAEITAIVGPVLDEFVLLNETAFKIITLIFDTFIKLLSGDFAGAWQNQIEIVQAFLDFFTGSFENLIAYVQGNIEVWTNAAKALGEKFIEGIVSVIDAGGDAIRDSIWAAKDSALAGLGHIEDWLSDVAWRIMRGFATSLLDAAWGTVKGALGTVGDLIPSWKGPNDDTLLTPAGITIMGSLADGIEQGSGAVKEILGEVTRDLAGQAQAAAASVVSTLAAAAAAPFVGAGGVMQTPGGVPITQLQPPSVPGWPSSLGPPPPGFLTPAPSIPGVPGGVPVPPELAPYISGAWTTQAEIDRWRRILGLDEGGIVMSPGLFKVAETRPEAVIPLDRLQGAGMGTFALTVNALDARSVIDRQEDLYEAWYRARTRRGLSVS